MLAIGKLTRRARDIRFLQSLAGMLSVLLAALVLSGCSPALAGATGIGIDAHGRTIGILRICDGDGAIDGAILDVDDRRAGAWIADVPVTREAQWLLLGETKGWSKEGDPLKLLPDRAYSLHGFSRDQSFTTNGVEFTAEDVSRMRPGEVRYWVPEGDDLLGSFKVGSLEEFQREACEPGF